MLVLTRNRGQQIVIGDGIVVTVQRVQGNRVTLSIDAPSDVHILRGELTRYQRQWDEPAETNEPAETAETSERNAPPVLAAR